MLFDEGVASAKVNIEQQTQVIGIVYHDILLTQLLSLFHFYFLLLESVFKFIQGCYGIIFDFVLRSKWNIL